MARFTTLAVQVRSVRARAGRDPELVPHPNSLHFHPHAFTRWTCVSRMVPSAGPAARLPSSPVDGRCGTAMRTAGRLSQRDQSAIGSSAQTSRCDHFRRWRPCSCSPLFQAGV